MDASQHASDASSLVCIAQESIVRCVLDAGPRRTL